MNRREFMRAGSVVMAGVCAGCLGGCEHHDSQTPPAPAGSVAVADGKLVVELDKAAALTAEGGSLKLREAGLPPVLVVHAGPDDYRAFRDECTHKGTPLDYQHDPQRLYCGHHHSQFGLDGAVLEGPATRPLPTFGVVLADGKLTINVG